MTVLPPLTDAEAVLPETDAGLGALRTERGNLPLRALDVEARVTGLLARTTLRQRFANTLGVPLEATYIFPLPPRAAVTGFRMEVGDRVVDGVLKERGEARAAYDDAIAAGQQASIAEQERPGVFTVRVGNLLPGEEAAITLTMAAPLPWGDGVATYRFPLVVAPRYIPGDALPGPQAGDGTAPDTDAVPDASRITPPVLLPGFPHPVALSVRIELDPAGLPLGEVRSSLHTVVRDEADGCRVLTVTPGERPDRDVVVRYDIAADGVAAALVTTPDQDDDHPAGGTFALTVVPPAGGPAETALPRDAVFVLDRSGSMMGWKMVAARRAVARMIDALGERDRFAVLAFDNVVEQPPGPDPRALSPATDRNRFQAVEFLAGLEARGGTELAQPLMDALDRLGPADPGRDRVLVLVTDGQVGNEDQILARAVPRLTGVRVFTVGIDTAVNEAFLERLASVGGGACELVESDDRLDEAMERVHRRVEPPVLSGLRIEPAGLGVDPDSVAPARLPDLFAGAPVLITGRWAGTPDGALIVRGRLASGEPWSATVPAAPGGDPVLTPVWARARIRDLEDSWAIGDGSADLVERQIVELSLRHGVLSRFTAFVAVDSRVVREGGELRRVTQPVELPAGWAPPPAPPMDLPRPMMAAGTAMAARVGSFAPAAGEAAQVKRRAPLPAPSIIRFGRRGRGKDLSPGLPGLPASDGPISLRAFVRELLDLIDRGLKADRETRLRRLAEGLERVVAMLRAGGAAHERTRPVEDAASRLRGLLAGAPAPEELDRAEHDARTALEALATGSPGPEPATPPATPPKAFWRRRPR